MYKYIYLIRIWLTDADWSKQFVFNMRLWTEEYFSDCNANHGGNSRGNSLLNWRMIMIMNIKMTSCPYIMTPWCLMYYSIFSCDNFFMFHRIYVIMCAIQHHIHFICVSLGLVSYNLTYIWRNKKRRVFEEQDAWSTI